MTKRTDRQAQPHDWEGVMKGVITQVVGREIAHSLGCCAPLVWLEWCDDCPIHPNKTANGVDGT